MKISVELDAGKHRIILEGTSVDELLQELDKVSQIKEKLSDLSLFPRLPGKNIGTEQDLKELTLPEFVAQSNAETALDKMMLIIYWNWRNNTEELNINDIKQGLKNIGEAMPQNIGALANSMLPRGLLAVGGRKDDMKSWKITLSGKKYVEDRLIAKNTESRHE